MATLQEKPPSPLTLFLLRFRPGSMVYRRYYPRRPYARRPYRRSYYSRRSY